MPMRQSTGRVRALVATKPVATRERLLDAAEQLFAERGFNGVSTREITVAADANSAAMHYHFGTKDAIIREIFERRLGPINAERERLIDEAVAAQNPPDISQVLRAFIGPTLSIGQSVGERHFKILAARSSMDPSPEVRQAVFTFYDSVGKKFVEAISLACPHLGREELFWRLACVYGAMLYVRGDNGRLQKLMGDDLSFNEPAAAMRNVIPFLAAGLSMPSIGEGQAARRSRHK